VIDGGEWLAPRTGRFTPGKESPYPVNRRCGGPQSRSQRFWIRKKKKFIPIEIRQNGNPGNRPAWLYDLDQETSNRNNDPITLPNGLHHKIKNETDTTAVSQRIVKMFTFPE
jgi:hypothetical protein